jgi:hypothetical protein
MDLYKMDMAVDIQLVTVGGGIHPIYHKTVAELRIK